MPNFMSRLDDAKECISRDRKDITPIKVPFGDLNMQSQAKETSDMAHKLAMSAPVLIKRSHQQENFSGYDTPNSNYLIYSSPPRFSAMDCKEALEDSMESLAVQIGAYDPQSNDSDDDSDDDGLDLVAACSEYLFDLFDANMLEDYHTMEKFENKAINAFMNSCEPGNEEITFAQHDLHDKFLDLFESLILKFVRDYSRSSSGSGGRNVKETTVEDFYEQVQTYLKLEASNNNKVGGEYSTPKGGSNNNNSNNNTSTSINNSDDEENAIKGSNQYKKERASEVVDVIFAYTDLSMWAKSMRERALLRRTYERKQLALSDTPKTQRSTEARQEREIAYKTQLQEALERSDDKRIRAANATMISPVKTHRFDHNDNNSSYNCGPKSNSMAYSSTLTRAQCK